MHLEILRASYHATLRKTTKNKHLTDVNDDYFWCVEWNCRHQCPSPITTPELKSHLLVTCHVRTNGLVFLWIYMNSVTIQNPFSIFRNIRSCTAISQPGFNKYMSAVLVYRLAGWVVKVNTSRVVTWRAVGVQYDIYFMFITFHCHSILVWGY